MRRFIGRALAACAVVLAAVTGAAAYSAVDNTLTAEDREAITAFLRRESLPSRPAGNSYEQQVAWIAAVQRRVLERVSGQRGIAFDSPREPRDVLAAGSGLCFDRSRVIEKMLRNAGLRTRHVAIYSTARTGSALVSLATPRVASHALSEVLTRRGWLVVDSNAPWLSLDASGEPVGIAAVRADVGVGAIRWDPAGAAHMNAILREPFTFVYGLYSRHGHFYPPYNPIPDIQYGEFVQNFL